MVSCEESEGILPCDGNCNVFSGRVYTEDNEGISDVKVSVLYNNAYPLGPSRTRLVATGKTDIDGNYIIEGYVKDIEFEEGSFYVTVDGNKIENSVSNEFFKPSEIYQDEDLHRYLIPNLSNRTQVINANYKIPYKTQIVVNLNNYAPTNSYDSFGAGIGIKYGFENEYNRFLTKQSNDAGFGFATGVNTSLIIPCVYGENFLRIYKFKNGLDEYIDNTIIINNPNNSPPFEYEF
jgi:hypothetical protein